LTSALNGGQWSASRPGRFTPREITPGTHWIGGLRTKNYVGPTTSSAGSILNLIEIRSLVSDIEHGKSRTSITLQ